MTTIQRWLRLPSNRQKYLRSEAIPCVRVFLHGVIRRPCREPTSVVRCTIEFETSFSPLKFFVLKSTLDQDDLEREMERFFLRSDKKGSFLIVAVKKFSHFGKGSYSRQKKKVVGVTENGIGSPRVAHEVHATWSVCEPLSSPCLKYLLKCSNLRTRSKLPVCFKSREPLPQQLTFGRRYFQVSESHRKWSAAPQSNSSPTQRVA